ncbi:endocuticle structural glycoprotein SgAbd-8 [Tribolium castaneum]|uniref:Larval cuticle protein 1-like Protein n=1 Tax=Tribolium castaneum TaxID=7070 RepID=D6WJM8_TRICA|nr:PREDICTED: endocuticle structural glycoprotein SgAbd-8 [Tribolium castaneum]EFA04467.1 Larval cuticle protein 1-like Protein [Tribolium castaneum]|eukprot:XP_969336.1 PREDICTED: endocuticle structural glycoprotein SgAbd-8 [Tribolium castaneum]
MIRLLMVCALAAAALADVSHILGRRPFAAPVRSVSVQPVVTATNYRPIAIVRQSQDVSPDGSYQYSYQTENGISAEETAQVRAVGNDLEKTAQGAFSWTSPEGEQVSVSYIADGNGYQPQGSHLPVAPPIPPAIQRALAWIAAHPQPESAVYGQRRF